MVNVRFNSLFKKKYKKTKDISKKEKVKKQIKKIVENPEIGKPMRYNRKGTRELYVKPNRISYLYDKEKNRIIFLFIFNKKEK